MEQEKEILIGHKLSKKERIYLEWEEEARNTDAINKLKEFLNEYCNYDFK